MPAYSFQETNSILPADFHVHNRLKISSYTFIKAYLFIREVRLVPFTYVALKLTKQVATYNNTVRPKYRAV